MRICYFWYDLSGIDTQSLAEPGIIGINAGASLAAVAVIVLFPQAPIYTLPLSAFAGALLMAVLIYATAWNNGSSPMLLIPIGVGLSAIATALTSLLITFGQISEVSNALVWLAGSVYGHTWEQVFSLLPWLMIFVPLALANSRHLNALNLGDDVAKGLGSRVEWQRAMLALAQDTDILLLDEPTTFLDLAHQIEVLDLLYELNHQGRTIVMVLHDLNQACRYAII